MLGLCDQSFQSKIVIIEIVMMINNNHDVNYLNNLVSCQIRHNPNNRCIMVKNVLHMYIYIFQIFTKLGIIENRDVPMRTITMSKFTQSPGLVHA